MESSSPGAATAESAAETILETVPALMRLIRAHMREGRAEGISVPQFRTLVYVGRHPGTDLSSVAEHLGASLPAASEMVSRLVRDGIVTRTQDPASRRRIRLALSPDGERALSASRARTLDWLAERLSGVPRDDIAQLEGALSALRRLLEDAEG